jgi:N-acetyl-anhydromuramyl-L-alanine amidase AmpD
MQEAKIQLPAGADRQQPVRIVVHAMAEYIWGGAAGYDQHAVDFLRKAGLSAHALVTPSGVVIRCRGDLQGAYHARGFNLDSLGVEFLVPGVHTYQSFLGAILGPYISGPQYQAGVELVKSWIQAHDITLIDGHSDLDPGRKYDPGAGFPMDSFLGDVKG